MKTVFTSFILFFATLFSASSENFVTPELENLLSVMNVQHNGTVKSIVEATQKQWLRPPEKERWQIEDTLTPVQREAVINFCKKSGFLHEIKPAAKSYNYAVVLGATVSRMEKRIAFLAKLADSGVRFKQVILLSGARPLDPSAESIPEGCKTEGDAMEYLWKTHLLSKQIPWTHYEHPMISIGEGKQRRPGAADTYRCWLQSKPLSGRCFLISNQPYVLHHHASALNVLPKELAIETVGPEADPASQNAAVLLDNLARWMYESSKH